MNKHVNKHKKVKEYKKPVKKKTFWDYLKCAPYTAVMIASVLGFWGYKAVSTVNAYTGKQAAETAEEYNPFEEIGKVESELTGIQNDGITDGSAKATDQGTADNIGDTEGSDGTEAEETSGSGIDEANGSGYGENGGTTGGEGESSGDHVSTEASVAKVQAAEADDVSGAEEDSAEDRFADLTEEELSAYPFSLGEIDGNLIVYEPKEIESRYYSDPGRVALDTPADYVSVEDDYYEDACFIGDSRMVGIYDYAGWDKADFYCDNGYCVYNYKGGKTVLCQNNGKKYTLEEAMDRKQYGKIYIMMGTNDCGYGNTEDFKNNYSDMLDMLKEKQPGAIIFTVANLRVSRKAEKEDKTGVYNNIDINDKNVAISELADGETVFYIDCNIPFVDENGYLIEENTFDGFHVYAKQYVEMSELFKAHGIVKEQRVACDSLRAGARKL